MTSAAIRPMRGLYRDMHPALCPLGGLREAKNVVLRKRGVLSPVEASAELFNFQDFDINRIVDCGTHSLIVSRQSDPYVHDLARSDVTTITEDQDYHHHGRWVVDGRVTVNSRVILITEAADVVEGAPLSIEEGERLHFHYGRWVVDDRVTLGGRVVLILDGTAWAQNAVGDTAESVSLPGEPISYEDGCAHVARYRDRVYWTSRQGLLCADAVGDATARRVGLPAPLFHIVSLTTVGTSDGSGSIAVDSAFNACAIFVRELSDGSFLRSPPCTPTRTTNFSAVNTASLRHTVNWSGGIELRAGDRVDVYRTEQVAEDTDPGEDYKLSSARVLTAEDIEAGFVRFDESVPDDGLGESLYTNTGEEGILNAYFPPPYLRDVVEYKGSLIGIMAREHETLTATLPGRFGTIGFDSEREFSWGHRPIQGDATPGVASITNVSVEDMVGIVEGQRVQHGQVFTEATYVVSASGSTIVTSNPAFGSASGDTFDIYDRMRIGDVFVDYSSMFGHGVDGRVRLENVDGITMRLSTPLGASVPRHVVFSWSRHYAYGEPRPFYVGVTNGQNFQPALGSLSEPSESKSYPHENRIAHSAPDLPESWPLINRQFIGTSPLVRLSRVGDAVYCFSDDGTAYRISGTAGDLRADPAWYGYRLLSSVAVASHGDTGYCWTDRGWVRFSDGAMNVISADRIGLSLRDEAVKSPSSPFNWNAYCAIDPVRGEAWLRARVVGGDGLAFIYAEAFDGEITEYTKLVGQTDLTFVRVLGGMLSGGRGLQGLYVVRSHVDALWEGDTLIEFQRNDLGGPSTLKNLLELSLGITNDGPGGPLDMACTVTGDLDGGDGTGDVVAIALYPSPQRAGRHHVMPVSRRSGQSSQYVVRLQTSGAPTPSNWQLEHVAMRFDLEAPDSTGARS